MFQRKNNSGSLPTTMSSLNVPSGDSHNAGGGGYGMGGFGVLKGSHRGGGAGPDGSGRAIKMDAPVVKAWKQSSTFTKYSYYILAVCVLMIFMGYRYLRYWNASIWLTCHAQECTLELTPPGSRTQTVVFSRTQLYQTQATRVDKNGKFLAVDTSKYEPPERGNKKKKGYKSGSYKGPDADGMYKSYCIKFHVQTPSNVEKTEEDVPDGDFSKVAQYLEKDRTDDAEGEVYVLHMRKFGLAQSRTRIRSMINKVESYMKRRRQKLLVKESAPLPWQGLLFLIFGLLGLMLTLIIGQFWEETTPRRQGGPGARRTPKADANSSSSSKKPTFVVDTGRPSKYPPGYNYHKKY